MHDALAPLISTFAVFLLWLWRLYRQEHNKEARRKRADEKQLRFLRERWGPNIQIERMPPPLTAIDVTPRSGSEPRQETARRRL